MQLSGFTYIRNGHRLKYPFVQSILSALPICDEMIVVVGDSDDGTRESIVAIGSPKIRIVDTVWDEDLKHGLVFREQSNIGLDNINGKWGLHIQADEILHENERDDILRAIEKYDSDKEVMGLLFPYVHFWGYHHVVKGRRARRYEIRVVRNDPRIRSYMDSQGFRIYPDQEAYDSGHRGEKIKVALITSKIYHYSRVREPKLEMEKARKLGSYLHDGQRTETRLSGKTEFDYHRIDLLKEFPESDHPVVMKDLVKNAEWSLGKVKPRFNLKNWLSNTWEDLTGHRIGEYTNWKIIRRP